MTYPKLKAELRNLLRQQAGGDAQICRVVAASEQEYRKRSARRRIGACAFMIRQIGFIGWRMWLLQAAALSVMIVGLRVALFFDMQDMEPRHIPLLLSCCGILTALTSAPMLGRAVRFRMMEVEAASRYSCLHLMAARLAIVALGDMMMLLGIIAAAAAKAEMGISGILFYAAVPSAILSALALLLFPHVPARSMPSLIWLAGAFEMMVIWLLNAFCPSFASQIFGFGWAVLCAALLAMGAWSAARSLKRTAVTDKRFAAI